MKPMPDLNEFALACHEASERKGWTNLKRTDSQTINLMVSENSEAVEDFRNKHPDGEIYYEYKGEKFTRGQIENSVEPPREKFKPCGIPIELADTIIRIGQQCGTHKLDLRAAMGIAAGESIVNRDDLNDMLADATAHLSDAWRASPRFFCGGDTISDGNDDQKYFFTRALARALTSITLFCTRHSIDIWAAVEEKMAFNEGRPFLHGGKAI